MCERSLIRVGTGKEVAKWIAVFLWVQSTAPHFSVLRHVTLTGLKDLAPKQPGVLFKLAFLLPQRNTEHLFYTPHTVLGQLSNNMDPGRGCCPHWRLQPVVPVAHSKCQRAFRTGVQQVG